MKRQQWQGFVRRGRLKTQETDLRAVVEAVCAFLMPVVAIAATNKEFKAHWLKRSMNWRPQGLGKIDPTRWPKGLRIVLVRGHNPRKPGNL